MSSLSSDSAGRAPAVVVILLLVVVAVLAGAAYWLAPRFEREGPLVSFTPDTGSLGLAPLEITVADRGTGLKSVTATLESGGAERTLVSESFDQPAPEKKFSVESAKLSGVKEGPAVLRITAKDGSLWNLFRGNETVIRKEIAIDITPPTVELIADDRYVNFGGVGVIVYKTSPDMASSGVKIGNHFFPGYPGQIKDRPDHLLAFFAHAYDLPGEAKAVLVATDKAGNVREMGLSYELRGVRYRKSTIAISDSFVQKVAPLLTDVGARQGTPAEVFVRINKDLRKENEDRIVAVTRKGSPKLLWRGAFTQLSNSKVEANFADERTYTYDKEPIDKAYHLGYDLSVTRNYPVEAANSGAVAFAGDLGIYGNTVILDHGLGLFTLYGHLSSIDVKVGEAIEQKQVLGKTGETGLAAGDHLHYGVYLNGVAVLPVEWWDPKWIADNVEPKLEGRTGQEIAESQQVPRRAAAKRRR